MKLWRVLWALLALLTPAAAQVGIAGGAGLSGGAGIKVETGGGGGGALAIDSQEASGAMHRSTSSPLTWSFANTAGTALYVGCDVNGTTGNAAISGVTYNGTAMTRLYPDQTWDSGSDLVRWYRLSSPATGSRTVSVTWSGGVAAICGAISFSGDASGTPTGIPVGAKLDSGTGYLASVIVPSTTSGNYVVAVGGAGSAYDYPPNQLTATSGKGTATFTCSSDEGCSNDTAGDYAIGEYLQASGSSTDIGFELSPAGTVSDWWGILAAEVRGEGSAASILASNHNAGATGTAVSIGAPAGTAAGDAVIVAVHCNSATTIVDNNGATAFTEDLNDWQVNPGTGMTVSVFSRRIAAGDPTTYNFTIGTSGRWSAVAYTIRNPDPTTIYDVAPNVANGANVDNPGSTTVAAPSISTTAKNAIHISLVAQDGSSTPTWTPPGGYTNVVDSTSAQSLAMAAKTIAAAGATGTTTWTATRSDGIAAISFAVN